MFAGLRQWVDAGWENVDRTWVRRQRPVLHALSLVIATHVLGLLAFLAAMVSGSPVVRILLSVAHYLIRLCAGFIDYPYSSLRYHPAGSAFVFSSRSWHPLQIIQPLSRFHNHIRHLPPQFLAGRVPRDPLGHTPDCYTFDSLAGLQNNSRGFFRGSWLRTDSVLALRSPASDLGMDNIRDLVRAIHVYRLCSTVPAGLCRQSASGVTCLSLLERHRVVGYGDAGMQSKNNNQSSTGCGTANFQHAA